LVFHLTSFLLKIESSNEKTLQLKLANTEVSPDSKPTETLTTQIAQATLSSQLAEVKSKLQTANPLLAALNSQTAQAALNYQEVFNPQSIAKAAALNTSTAFQTVAQTALNYQPISQMMQTALDSQLITTKSSKKTKKHNSFSKIDIPYSDHLMRVQNEHIERKRKEDELLNLQLEKARRENENPAIIEKPHKHNSELLDIQQAVIVEFWENHNPQRPPKDDVVIAWIKEKYPLTSDHEAKAIDLICRPYRYKSSKKARAKY
jgi:hypothetical protein